MFIKVIGFIVFYKYYSLTLVLHFFLLGCIFDLIRFKQAYSESIYPVGDKAYWDIPLDVAKFVCRPPSTRFPSGRRKKKKNSKFVGVWKIPFQIPINTQRLQMQQMWAARTQQEYMC